MNSVLITLFQNAALLLAMMIVYDLVISLKALPGRWLRQVISGSILGGLSIGLMLASFELEKGIIFDTRSVLLSLSGLFFGLIPTLIAAALAAAYRLWLGGAGFLTGVLVILSTSGIGLLWRYSRQKKLADISLQRLYGFGVVVHLVMLALMLTLPWEDALRALKDISLPVLLIYPLATVALGSLLSGRVKRENAHAALADREAQFSALFENMNAGFVLFEVVWDDRGRPVDLIFLAGNQDFVDAAGLKLNDAVGKRLTQVLPGIKNDSTNWIETCGRVAKTGEVLKFEQGSEYFGGYYAISIFQAQPNQCAATFIDISDRVRVEEELRQLKDALQAEVALKTKELKERVELLEQFHDATITRELRMQELREEIARLKGETK